MQELQQPSQAPATRPRQPEKQVGCVKMSTLWNHWFWITLGLCSHVLGDSLPLQLADSEQSVPSLVAGARGGRILTTGPALAPPRVPLPVALLRIPFRPQHGDSGADPFRFAGPSVSVSKSVSKVSVKMGKISVEHARPDRLAQISDIYTDPDLGGGEADRSNQLVDQDVVDVSNRLEYSRPQGRRIDPQFVSYNLVYREPPRKTTTTPKPAGLLHTIIAKLKSFARATSSGIRFSSLLLGSEVPPHSPPPIMAVPRPHPPKEVLVQIDDLGVVGGHEPVLTNEKEAEEQKAEDNVVLQLEESQPEPLTGSADRLEDVLDSLEEVDNEVEEDRPRSSEARGRSLPLHVIDEIEIKSMNGQLEEEDSLIKIKEINSEEWEEQTDEEGEEEEVSNQEDFDDFTDNQLNGPVSENYRIEMERVGTANISAIIGVVVGIIIFIIISIVLILLAVQRGRGVKKACPADDVVSQSSYMTYSTTVSDQSVHYGPNWEKDIVDDLCSLDNDSFLNSLEAVATTDYWVDCKY